MAGYVIGEGDGYVGAADALVTVELVRVDALVVDELVSGDALVNVVTVVDELKVAVGEGPEPGDEHVESCRFINSPSRRLRIMQQPPQQPGSGSVWRVGRVQLRLMVNAQAELD